MIRRILGQVLLSGACAALLLAGPVSRAAGQSLQDAASRYDSGDFIGAEAIYGALIASAPRAAALHYNRGNALFKAGELGKAIAAYQRAFAIHPRDADIRYNLSFALEGAGETLVPPGVPPMIFKLFTLVSESELATLHWIGCWAALLLGSLLLLREGARQRLLPWIRAALIFWLLSGGWWGLRRSLESGRRGVIISDSAEIRSGPGENFAVNFTAPEGRRIEILSDTGAWLEIGVLKEGVKGWLASDSVEVYSE